MASACFVFFHDSVIVLTNRGDCLRQSQEGGGGVYGVVIQADLAR